MRSLRSRTIEDKSGSSEADISKSASKISKKKYRSRKSRKASRKLDSSNDSPETNSDILNKSRKSIELNKTRSKMSRRTRNVKRNSYQEENENSEELSDMKQFMVLIEKCNDEPHSDLDKEELPSGSFLKSLSSGSSFNQQEISAIINPSPNNVSSKGFTKMDDCILIDDDSSEANNEIFENKNLSFSSKHIEKKSYNGDNCEIVNRSGLWNTKEISCELTDEDAQFSDGFSKYNEISNNTINKNLLKKDYTVTDDSVKLMNQTFETQNQLLLNKDPETTPNRRDTFQIENRSGQWNVEDIINISDEIDDKKLNKSSNIFHSTKHLSPNRITLHPKRNSRSKLHNLNDTFDTPSKSNRKKWVKFQTQNSTDSPLLRKITYSGLKSTLPLLSSSPVDKKQENGTESAKAFQALKQSKKESKEKSFNILNSNTKSNKKNGIKPTTMPNFALIHQKAFEKMESLKDYSERKKLRAKELMSSEKLHAERNKENKKSVVKSSQDLFGSSQTYNKFGFKINIPKPNNKKIEIRPQVNKPSCLPTAIRKPMNENVSKSQPRIEPINRTISKPQPRIVVPTSTSSHLKFTEKPVPVFSKGHYMAIANKSKVNEKLGNRNNRRDQLKGVRTNRRFELLMRMRNNS